MPFNTCISNNSFKRIIRINQRKDSYNSAISRRIILIKDLSK